MEFLRKSLMVANRVMTKVTSIPTCSSIVSRYSVDIEFLIAELNDLNIMACDVVNAYLNAPCRENIWSALGPYHRPEKTGNIMVTGRDLYGLKSSGSAWRYIYAKTLNDVDFVPMVADP